MRIVIYVYADSVVTWLIYIKWKLKTVYILRVEEVQKIKDCF